MKNRVIALISAYVIVTLILACIGGYIQGEILKPLELSCEYSILELPFALLTDDALRYSIEDALLSVNTPSESDPTQTQEPTQSQPTEPGSTSPSATIPPVSQPTNPAPTEPTPSTPQPTEPKPTEPKPTKPVNPPVESIPSEKYPNYDFSSGAVSPEWYDDALFIGESRTVGLRDYGRMGKADYFCKVGTSVFNYKSKTASDKGFPTQTLESLLQSKTYGKILINLGINECGYSAKSIIKKYQELLDLIRKYQPDAVIIIQGVMVVTEGYIAKTNNSFDPKNIANLNQKLEKLARDNGIYYIHVNTYFANNKGYLYDDLTYDGCHLYGSCYPIWAKWISYAIGQLGL